MKTLSGVLSALILGGMLVLSVGCDSQARASEAPAVHEDHGHDHEGCSCKCADEAPEVTYAQQSWCPKANKAGEKFHKSRGTFMKNGVVYAICQFKPTVCKP